ncbi:putative hepatocyte growth factor-like [Trypanosoma grayi]|uniref:putative hepatocyte growth factor-like n=1 Tax=Trypanosoma grayi TaxID=71804 RepID=UPI0004F42A6B|nr:putative hepatocyte growth factor-like [Trypanosoma grayi]KEG10385.1 putative hepatocyte growth factor-like [Trypanosoma grayi]
MRYRDEQGSFTSARLHGPLLVGVLLLLCLAVVNVTAVAAAQGSTCDPVEGYYLRNGEDYRGHVNVTENGIPCQNWAEQRPHKHDTIVPNPLNGVGNHNYCRNPSGLDRPGCLTTNPSVRYQFCRIGPPCNSTPIEPVLYYEPKSGTRLQVGQPITITCFPRPCSIHYTLDGTPPNTEFGTLYSRPFVLTKNTTVKAIALFASNRTLSRQAFYSVPPPPPERKAYFSPPSTVTYRGPVLVVVKGLKKNNTVLIFKNSELRGTPYEGPFWLNETTNLTAVLDEQTTIHASYTILATGAQVELYPVSGRYIGGASCLVYQPTPNASYAVSINETQWEPLDGMVFVVDSVGTTSVAVKATYLGGVESIAWRTYEVVEAIPPVLTPVAAVVYTRPIRVTCADPVGRPLAVGVLSDEELLLSVRLNTPGQFTVNCSYVDDLHRTQNTIAVYKLQPVPLPMPKLLPECGHHFPMTPIVLTAAIVPPPDAESEEDLSRLSVSATVTNARLRPLPEGSSFVLEAEQSVPVNVSVALSTRSSHPLEGESEILICRYEISPLGSLATPWFVGRPTCGNPTGCTDTVARQLASCMSFYTTALIQSTMVGPFMMIRVARLPISLQMEYYTRVGKCLLDASLSDVRNETSGSIQLAHRWYVSSPSSSSDFMTGVQVMLVVEGWGLDACELYLVRREHSCDDIGVNHVDRSTMDTYSEQLTFIVDTPGSYKLCAAVNGAIYAVPSPGLLVVRPRPSPLLQPTPCGGRSEGPIAVLADVAPRSVYPDAFTSIDTGAWYKIAAGTVVRLDRLTATKPSVTVALSPGQRCGASMTCVFYAPQGDAPRWLTYKWTIASVRGSVNYVLLAVNGTFSGDARVEFRAYSLRQNVTNTLFFGRVATASRSGVMSRSYGNKSMEESLIFTSLGTAVDAFAVADGLLPLTGSADEYPFFLMVVIDGVSVSAEPLELALSPLSVAMHSCPNCTSGWCFADRCVCIGKENRTAYFCSGVPSPMRPSTSSSTHLVFLLAYMALLTILGVNVGMAIKDGTRKRARKEALGVTVESL